MSEATVINTPLGGILKLYREGWTYYSGSFLAEGGPPAEEGWEEAWHEGDMIPCLAEGGPPNEEGWENTWYEGDMNPYEARAILEALHTRGRLHEFRSLRRALPDYMKYYMKY